MSIVKIISNSGQVLDIIEGVETAGQARDAALYWLHDEVDWVEDCCNTMPYMADGNCWHFYVKPHH